MLPNTAMASAIWMKVFFKYHPLLLQHLIVKNIMLLPMEGFVKETHLRYDKPKNVVQYM